MILWGTKCNGIPLVKGYLVPSKTFYTCKARFETGHFCL